MRPFEAAQPRLRARPFLGRRSSDAARDLAGGRTRGPLLREGRRPGFALAFEIADGGAVTVRKAVALDQAFADALQSQLSEWASDEDDEAYRGL